MDPFHLYQSNGTNLNLSSDYSVCKHNNVPFRVCSCSKATGNSCIRSIEEPVLIRRNCIKIHELLVDTVNNDSNSPNDMDMEDVPTLEKETRAKDVNLDVLAEIAVAEAQLLHARTDNLIFKKRKKDIITENSPDSFISVTNTPSSPNTNPNTNVNTKQTLSNHIPRPPNCYMLFRRDIFEEVKASILASGQDAKNDILSSECARRWLEADPSVKKKYNQLALDIALDHKRKYPNFKYHYNTRKKREFKASSNSRSDTL